MKSRRPARGRRHIVMLEMLQHQRLAALARGESEPNCEREELFLKALRTGRRVRARDYVLPALLFRVEQAQMVAARAIMDRVRASREDVILI